MNTDKTEHNILLEKVLIHRLFHINKKLYEFIKKNFERNFKDIIAYDEFKSTRDFTGFHISVYERNRARADDVQNFIESIRNTDNGLNLYFYQLKELLIITEKELSSFLGLELKYIKDYMKKNSIRRVRQKYFKNKKSIKEDYPSYELYDKTIKKGYCLYELCEKSNFLKEKILSFDMYDDINFVEDKFKSIDERVFLDFKEDKFKWKRNDSLRIELDCLNVIEKHLKSMIKDITFIRQYTVIFNQRKWYRIDLYIPEYNIAVECDEPSVHSGSSNKYFDGIREKEIIDKINCRFARFNPFEKGFNPYIIADNLYNIISRSNPVVLSKHGDIKIINKQKYEELKRLLLLLEKTNLEERVYLFEQKWVYDELLNEKMSMFDFQEASKEIKLCFGEGTINYKTSSIKSKDVINQWLDWKSKCK